MRSSQSIDPLGEPVAWLTPPTDLSLPQGETHVWRAFESEPSHALDAFSKTLSPDELARASAFRFEVDRRRFVQCRGILRELLGRYLAQSPGSITLACGPRGKPRLGDGNLLQFNLSHTKGVSMFAFAQGVPVGIDVEMIRGGRDMESISREFFHPNEWAAITAVPPGNRDRVFHAMWTCKEAWLKVEGTGIAGGFDAFEVVLPSNLLGEVIVHGGVRSAAPTGWIYLLEPGPGWSAAIGCLRRPTSLRTWQYIEMPADRIGAPSAT